MPLDRIEPYIKNLAKAKDSAIDSELGKLRRAAEALSVKTDDGLPMTEGLEAGLYDGRDHVRLVVSDLQEELILLKTQPQKDQVTYRLNGITIPNDRVLQKGLPRAQGRVTGLWNRISHSRT